jgi:hypothetical protein
MADDSAVAQQWNRRLNEPPMLLLDAQVRRRVADIG